MNEYNELWSPNVWKNFFNYSIVESTGNYALLPLVNNRRTSIGKNLVILKNSDFSWKAPFYTSQ